MELPVKKAPQQFHTLEEIRERKEQLLRELQQDNTKFSTLWDQTFVKREGSTKGEYFTSIISNSFTAIDTFLLVRKLIKNYGHLLGLSKKPSSDKSKKKH